MMDLEQAHRGGYDLVRTHTDGFVEYVRSLTDDELARPVPGLDWTVGDVVVHLRSVCERYTIDRRRAPTAAGVAEQNGDDIARLGDDVAEATESIEAHVQLMAKAVERFDPTDRFPFHAGTTITLAGGWGNLLGELHAHGDDIARATGKPFAIPSSDLEITWRYTVSVLEGWLRSEAAGLEESWVLAFPFGEITLKLAGGHLHVAPSTAGGGARIEVNDVAAWTLQFPYRRRAISDPAVALLASRFRDL